MAIRPLLIEPDPRLHQVAVPITVFDARLRDLVRDLTETMYATNLIGLAASQIDVHERVIVVDVDYAAEDATRSAYHFINPEIIEKDGENVRQEGCGSVPEVQVEVTRPETIRLRYQDVEGTIHELDADGLFACCIQHEMDHLDGKLIIDYLSDLKREMAIRKLTKLKKQLSAHEIQDSVDEPAR